MFVGVGASRVRDLFDQAKKNCALHRLRRRDRRRRPPARRRPRRRPRRARADPEPDPGRDGRLRHQHQRHRDRRHQPAGRAGPGAAAARPLRPPRDAGPARHPGPPPILDVHARNKPLDDDGRPRRAGPPDAGLLRRRPGQPDQRGRHPGRARATRRRSAWRSSRRRSTASSPAPSARAARISEQEKEVIAYHEVGHALVHEVAAACATRCTRSSIIARGMALGWTLSLPGRGQVPRHQGAS